MRRLGPLDVIGAPAPAPAALAPARFPLFLGGVPGQCQEYVVERRPPQGQPLSLHAGAVQAPDGLDQRLRAAAPDTHVDHPGLLVHMGLSLADPGDRLGRVGEAVAIGHRELQHVPADPSLELLGGARGDDQTVVDDDDLVGQLVRLIQVLGGEQGRRPGRHQRPDDLPHPQPGSRVQAGGRLVQEQHLRGAHQARGQVQAALHATGVGLGRPVGRVAQAELLQQLGGAAAGLAPAQVVQPPDELQVLPAGELFLDGRRLSGQADRAAYRTRLPDDVIALDQGPAAIREQQRGQDPHGGCLARAVRAEYAEHGPARHRQVDTAKRVYLAEGLGQALDKNRRPGGGS